MKPDFDKLPAAPPVRESRVPRVNVIFVGDPKEGLVPSKEFCARYKKLFQEAIPGARFLILPYYATVHVIERSDTGEHVVISYLGDENTGYIPTQSEEASIAAAIEEAYECRVVTVPYYVRLSLSGDVRAH